jgi:hypothetical protein
MDQMLSLLPEPPTSKRRPCANPTTPRTARPGCSNLARTARLPRSQSRAQYRIGIAAGVSRCRFLAGPPCTERKSLNQECAWKGGDKSGPARMQGIHRKERENRKSKQKQKNTLDSYPPVNSWKAVDPNLAIVSRGHKDAIAAIHCFCAP